MSQNQIAVGIIVENGFEGLQETLRSAHLLSDSVFVLSTESVAAFSTESVGNATKSVGNTAEYPNVIYCQSKSCHDEAALRNELIELAESQNTADWLLLMNVGEHFDKTTVEDFRLFLAKEVERNSLYVMVLYRLHREDGIRHDLDEETIEPRLIPLRKGLRFQGQVRSSILGAATNLMIRLNAAPGRFIRPSRQRDVVRQKKQAIRNLQTLELLEKQGKSIADEPLLVRAEAQLTLGDYIHARRDFFRLIEETTQPEIRLASYYGLWETLTLLPVPAQEMTKILLAGLDRFPVDMQLLTFMGSHLQRQGQLDLAARTFETAIRYGQTTLDIWHRLRIREMAVTSLALIHRLRGKGEEAIQVFESNLELIDDRTEFNRHLLDLYIAELQESKGHEIASTIWGGKELDLIRDVITGACQASAGNWTQAATSLELSYLSGCRDVLCLRWYSLVLLSLTRFNEAEIVLKEWNHLEPENKEPQAFLSAVQQPEHFSDIVRQFRDSQIKILGLSKPEVLGKHFTKNTPNIKNIKITKITKNTPSTQKPNKMLESAISEMISSSGLPNSKKIMTAAFRKSEPAENNSEQQNCEPEKIASH
ncbi:MAG: tetratricopeptide repeat protein [Planctomycetaceae bacterium]|jgi:tetratricopeptide (TPR) repeat protein|nr:tetratricopeptide repeat protein [Planctomycetaceae bacterium]